MKKALPLDGSTPPACTFLACGRSARQDRSEKTRQRLIEVAVEVFAELGYEAASTRTIVEQAQANLVSIPYYFGNKLGLYHAAAEFIATSFAQRFCPMCDKIQVFLQQPNLTHEQLLARFSDFIIEFAHLMIGVETPRAWNQFIFREHFCPTEAYEIIHAKFAPLLDVGIQFVARLSGKTEVDTEARLQFLSLVAMVRFIRSDRAMVMSTMGWQTLGEAEIETVCALLRRSVETFFAHPRLPSHHKK